MTEAKNDPCLISVKFFSLIVFSISQRLRLPAKGAHVDCHYESVLRPGLHH